MKKELIKSNNGNLLANILESKNAFSSEISPLKIVVFKIIPPLGTVLYRQKIKPATLSTKHVKMLQAHYVNKM